MGAIPITPAKRNDNMERKYTPHELWDIYMRGKPPKKGKRKGESREQRKVLDST